MKKLLICFLPFLCSVGFACSIESYVSVLPEDGTRVPLNTSLKIDFYGISGYEEAWALVTEKDDPTEFEFYLNARDHHVPLAFERQTSRNHVSGFLLTPISDLKGETNYQLTASNKEATLVLSTFRTSDEADTRAPVWLGVSEIEENFPDRACGMYIVQGASLKIMGAYDDYDIPKFGIFLPDATGEINYDEEPFDYSWDGNTVNLDIHKATSQYEAEDIDAFTKIGIRPVDRVGNWGRIEELKVDLSTPPYVFKNP